MKPAISDVQNGISPPPAHDYHTARFSYDARRDVVWQEICRYLERRHIEPSARVLELGAGYCHFINNVKAAQKHALDTFAELPAHAGPDVASHVQDCRSLRNFADGSFDVVLASNLFEHLTREQFVETLAEVRRVLRGGGRLIVLQPNFKYCCRHYFDDYTHVAVYTEVSMANLLEVSGFRIRDCQPRFLPFSMKSRLPKSRLLVRLYLNSPYRPFAAQMLIVAESGA